ncbi:AAA family ATPase [Synoicihabitans lomoniglobus]|uniref:AAA family ATPase n=1 Tax=Synoicihabitans lomoniglobus TaxID=2909285 RepID=A0AAF0A089_9BACT|nr:AAA family ATPase [Opitutaceae bacterium LMO-M01]WED64828.1 AAA family ATPase [Opitutaceae bacterium LMO-M01]
MKATLMKRLFRVLKDGSSPDVNAICRRIVDEEKKRGHNQVAKELEQILAQTPIAPKRLAPASLSPLPTNRRDSAPLLTEIPVEKLRHDMVLPEMVESRLARIEREFAARSRLAKHGLRPRHRILLYGPPGCGKNLGAERLAWHTGLPLRKVRFDNLLSSYFGETMSNLRRVFDAAHETPCALFLDECDTLARTRNARNDVGEVTRITNALLEMLEDYRGDGLVIAATNLDSDLDPALFRRFDEVLKIPLPGAAEIRRLLELTLAPIGIETDLPLTALAREMDGMSGSDVVHAAQSAAKLTVLSGRRKVSESDIRHALAEAHERHVSR